MDEPKSLDSLFKEKALPAFLTTSAGLRVAP